MSKLLFEFDVEMDDGEKFQVVADQRDVAKFEVQPFGFPFNESAEQHLGMGTMRFLAWSAAYRQQLTKLEWLAFDAQCVEAMPPDDEEASPVPADASHPGQQAPSATPSSRSRTRAGKH